MSDMRCEHCGLQYWVHTKVCARCGGTLTNAGSRETWQPLQEEFRRIYSWEFVRHPGWLAAIWFACAGCIPGLVISLFAVRDSGSMGIIIVWITIVPALIAALFGACLGARILGSGESITGFGSFCRGSLVALLSFITLIVTMSIALGGVNLPRIAEAILFFAFWGFILVGWETLIVGGLAGWLLYWRYH